MPAKGWKKDKAKSKVIKLRVEPDFAERVVQEAGEGDGSVSAAFRTAALAGLDTIDRRRRGLGGGGKIRVEMTKAEEATRDQQVVAKARDIAFGGAPVVDVIEEQRARAARRGVGPSKVEIRACPIWVTREGAAAKKGITEGPVRTFVAAHTDGKGCRVLLHSKAVDTPDDVIAIHKGYHERWKVETLAKMLKEGAPALAPGPDRDPSPSDPCRPKVQMSAFLQDRDVRF